MDLTTILETVQLASLFISAACFIAVLAYVAFSRRRREAEFAEKQKQSRVQADSTPPFFHGSIRVLVTHAEKSGKGFILDMTPISPGSTDEGAKTKTKAKTEPVEPAKPEGERKEEKKEEESGILFRWEEE